MRITRKLIIVTGIILILTGLIIYVIFSINGKFERSLTRLDKINMPSLDQLTMMKMDIVTGTGKLQNYLSLKTPEDLELFYREMEEFDSQAESFRNAMGTDSSGRGMERGLFNEALTAKKELMASVARMLDSGADGKNPDPALQAAFREQTNRAISLIDRVTDSKRAKIAGDHASTLRDIAMIRGLIFLLMVMLILYTGISGAFVYHSILIPLKRMKGALSDISKSKLHSRTNTGSLDEIDEMSEIIKYMALHLYESEDELIYYKSYAENITSSIDDTLILFDLKGKIKKINKATSDLLGYEEHELVGKAITTIFTEEEKLLSKIQLEKIIEKGSFKDYEMDCRTKTGEVIPVRFSGAMVKNKKGNPSGIIGIVRDMREARKLIQKEEELAAATEAAEVERTRAEELKRVYESLKKESAEREKIEAQLRHSQKMEAVGELAGGIAHDFNNLLTSILGHAELAMTSMKEKDDLYGELEDIHKAATLASSLTRQLLLFSRKQLMMSNRALDLNRSINEMLKMLKRVISEEIAMKIDLQPDLFTIEVDETYIGQMIMNMVVNARDSMPKGGVITIKTENQVIDEKTASENPDSRPGRFVCLSIADAGIGMSKEIVQHIFEPFFTTKDRGKGTGLGLSVVYGIIRQLNGWINVQSSPGQGSTFRIYLPATEASVKEPRDAVVSIDSYSGKGERILLVEDEEVVRKFATQALLRYGYDIKVAKTAEEALEIFEREKGELQIVISDMILPDMNGLELCENLLAQKPQIKVILCSGYAGEKIQFDKIGEKGILFLNKPYSLEELLKNIREALRG